MFESKINDFEIFNGKDLDSEGLHCDIFVCFEVCSLLQNLIQMQMIGQRKIFIEKSQFSSSIYR